MVVAVIVAAGRATRMAGAAGADKNLLELLGQPVLRRCLDVFDGCPAIDGIVIVTAAERVEQYRQLTMQWQSSKVLGVVAGGDTRTASVAAGLAAVPQECQIVAIHDCARPFVTVDIIGRTIDSARQRGSGVAAIASRDTVKQVQTADGRVLHTPPREQLRLVQTPQTFRLDALRAAYDAVGNGAQATDDAGLLEAAGQPVYLVEGSVDNIKLTTPEDIAHGEAILRSREKEQQGSESPWVCHMQFVKDDADMQSTVVLPRIGEGFDVHRLVEGRKLILGGVEIAHRTGLLGHSDADVLTHAIMDALLGAAALGDIGKHFPDSDPAYSGADSLALLRHVAALLAREGYAIGNVDATVAAQKPRLAAHIPQMRANLAEAMGVSVDRVSVKATTTEKLGYEGREEGISAQAVALIISRLAAD